MPHIVVQEVEEGDLQQAAPPLLKSAQAQLLAALAKTVHVGSQV